MCCRALLLLLSMMSLALGQDATADKVRKTIRDDAALRAFEQSVSSLQLQSPGTLAGIILGDAPAHAKKDASRKLVLDSERQHLQTLVRTQLGDFARTQSDLEPGWVDRVLNAQQRRLAAVVEKALNAGFEERFNQARETAVQTQRTSLAAPLAPSPKEIEAATGPYRDFAELPLDAAQRQAVKSGAPTIARHVAAANAGHIIFEENSQYLRDRAAEVFSLEAAELWQQLRYIVSHTGGVEIEASRIARTITKGLSGLPSKHALFPVTAKAIRDTATELERAKFVDNIKAKLTPPACSGLKPEMVLKDVPADPGTLPNTLDEHVAAMLPANLQRAVAGTLEQWVSSLPEPDRKALRQRLEKALGSSELKENVTDDVSDCVRYALRAFRETVAARELARVAPEVASLTFAFDDGQIAKLFPEQRDPDEQLIPSPRLHLEESKRAFEESRRKLVAEATAAVKRQMALVDEDDRVQHFRQMLGKSPSIERINTVRTQYERAVADSWNSQRREVLQSVNNPVPNADKYRPLFGITKTRITEKLSQLVPESASKDANQAGRGGGGSGQGGGTGNVQGPGNGGGGGGGGGCSSQSVQAVQPQQRASNISWLWIVGGAWWSGYSVCLAEFS